MNHFEHLAFASQERARLDPPDDSNYSCYKSRQRNDGGKIDFEYDVQRENKIIGVE